MNLDAMKQALEALEEVNKLSIGENAICLPAEIDGAMDALRAAIEQAQGLADKIPARGTLLEQTLGKVWDEMPHPDYQKEMKRLDHIRIRIMQEAYDLADRDDSEGYNSVKVMCSEVLGMIDRLLDERQWQGLTDDDIAQAMYRADAIITGPMQFKFAREIEAKLKEKNHE